MRVMMRTWPALCALGAGLVHLAVSASSPWWWAIPLIVIGAAELAWSIAYLIRDAPVLPRAMLAVALAPVAALGVLTTVEIMAQHGSTMSMGSSAGSGMTMPAAPPLFPFIVASVLDLIVAACCAAHLRRARAARTPTPDGRAGALRTVAGIVLGAALVAVVTVPALGSTDVGHEASQHMMM